MLLAAATLAVGVASPARADPVKCQRSILKQGDKLAQTVAKLLRKCEERKRKGKLPPVTVCAAEPRTAAKIAQAETKLEARIAKDCGGKDKVCGTGDDDALAGIGWPTQCPDFAGRGCTNAIASCADVAECVRCVNRAAVGQAVTLAYGALVATDKRKEKKLYRCQGAVGAELVRLYAKQSKALGTCWDKRHKRRHGNDCPEPGDGKTAPRIAKARAKLVARICKVCGGADKACGGGDDFSPGDIGFVGTCPAVGTCAAPIMTLGGLADCLTCTADFQVDCATSLSVPAFVSYPAACAPAPPTPTGVPTLTPTPALTPAPTLTATAAGPSASATPILVASATPTPTPGPGSCVVAGPGTATTEVTVSLAASAVAGAATVLLAYPIDLVRLPAAGGGAPVRARTTDLTGGELFDDGSPNNQDSDADQVPDRLRLSLVSITGVTGAVLAVVFDRCDGAILTVPGDYECTVANVVETDGVTPIAGASCSIDIMHG